MTSNTYIRGGDPKQEV